MQIAANLVAGTQMMACTGAAAIFAACEPRTLRYRFLHVAARLTRSGRRRRVKIPETWPWATAIVAVFNTIAAIPKPPDPTRPPTTAPPGEPLTGSASRHPRTP